MKSESVSSCCVRAQFLVCAFFCILIFAPVIVIAQQPPLPQSTPQAQNDTAKEPSRDSSYRPPAVLLSGDEDYQLGAGDLIEIKIADAEELSGPLRVRADGTIKMHFLGRILALGKTPEELANTIADGLRGRYLFDPQVSVVVREYNSRALFIQGAVNRPGVYQIEGRPHLLQLLVLAGGLLQNHGSTAYVIRRIKVSASEVKVQEASLKQQGSEQTEKRLEEQSDEQPRLRDAEWLAKQYTLLKININGLFRGRFDQNMFLEPGDIVNIPPTDVFFISGEVKAPGSFPLKEGTSLRQAVALAQGLTVNASSDHGIIFRENPETGKRLEIPIDVDAVNKGKQDDLLVYANDVIIIPTSKLKTFAMPLVNMATFSALTLLLNRVFY